MHVGFAFQSNLTGLQTVYQNGRKSDQEFANGDMNFQKFSERQMDRIPGTSAEAWCKNGSQCQLQPITRRREVSADKVSSMMGGACIDMSMEEIGTVYGRAVLSTLPAVPCNVVHTVKSAVHTLGKDEPSLSKTRVMHVWRKCSANGPNTLQVWGQYTGSSIHVICCVCV